VRNAPDEAAQRAISRASLKHPSN
ncbi:hypothetical protein A2U01_0066010, partial [Trifolium medium]|nr:hypothetical protein [Trifolium medium]